MGLIFVLMEFRKNSDRLEREIVLPNLSLEKAQQLLSLDASELMYECFPISDPVAQVLQRLSPTALDFAVNDYYLERREEEPKA